MTKIFVMLALSLLTACGGTSDVVVRADPTLKCVLDTIVASYPAASGVAPSASAPASCN